MKKLSAFVFTGILCGIDFPAMAQYLGGIADGFSSNIFIAAGCAAQQNSNIFFGGNAEGSASRSFIASVCPVQLNSNIYFGGNAEGSVSQSFIAGICPPQPNSNIFFGGNADGSVSRSLITSICPPGPNLNIFFGGNADGFVGRSLIISVCPPLLNSNIYYGGNADGSKFGKLIASPCIILPIELMAFSGVCEKQKIILTWSTATERDNHYFTIESSDDGNNWESRGRIEGAGNSVTIRNYVFYDSMPVPGTLVYYRLKQTDYDDNYKYWYIISVDKCGDNSASSLTAFPNASSGKFNLLFNGDKNTIYATEIFNALGEKIYAAQGFQSKFDLTEQTSGVYYLNLVGSSQLYHLKVVIEK